MTYAKLKLGFLLLLGCSKMSSYPPLAVSNFGTGSDESCLNYPWESFMMFDYAKEAEAFATELKKGKYSGGFLGNSGSDYQEREDDDLAAFKSYLKSDTFKFLNKEASRQ